MTVAVDFFISYTRVDSAWAEWIAQTLEDAGYSTKLQAWDFRPGNDFIYKMQQATQQADRTIAVLTPAYLESQFGEIEWREALARDPSGELGSLLPVRVADVTPPGLLRTRIYIDLVGLDELAAARELVAGVDRSRAKPSGRRPYPGGQLEPGRVSFPGQTSTIRVTPSRSPQAVVDDPKMDDRARSMPAAGRHPPSAAARQLREESKGERQGRADRQAPGPWVRNSGSGKTKPSSSADSPQSTLITPVRAVRQRVATYLQKQGADRAARPRLTGLLQHPVRGVFLLVIVATMAVVAFTLRSRGVDALISPEGLALDAHGNLYVTDSGSAQLHKVAPDGRISNVVSTGRVGFSSDDGAATNSRLNHPTDVAVDTKGNLYIADSYNHRIRKVSTTGTITTVAGSGYEGISGDGGAATKARLSYPSSVAVDVEGNLYICDNGRVRKVSMSGTITTVAGGGRKEFLGDGGAATKAGLMGPADVAVDVKGNLYIADSGNDRVRKVDAHGKITTVAGTGFRGFSGDGGPATRARLSGPTDVAVDARGNLYIADSNNHRIRKVSTTGKITTVAGTGILGSSGDGGEADKAQLGHLGGLAVDAKGSLYITERYSVAYGSPLNNKSQVSTISRLRRITADGTITTMVS